MRIDLNADVGEGGDDHGVFPLVTSVSVACGAHAGDEATMERCVVEAASHQLAVGAHPGYADREHMGRRELSLPPHELRGLLIDQITSLARVAERNGLRLAHVKPHGALYNQAAVDPGLAAVVAEAVRVAGDSLFLVGLAGSELIGAALTAGLRPMPEAFADRRYVADGTLAPRGLGGALIEDPEEAAQQAVRLARGDPVGTVDGGTVRIRAATICVHADTPNAEDIARTTRAALQEAGFRLASP